MVPAACLPHLSFLSCNSLSLRLLQMERLAGGCVGVGLCAFIEHLRYPRPGSGAGDTEVNTTSALTGFPLRSMSMQKSFALLEEPVARSEAPGPAEPREELVWPPWAL